MILACGATDLGTQWYSSDVSCTQDVWMGGGELQVMNSADASFECPKMFKGCKKIIRQRELIIEDSSLLGHYALSSRSSWRL
jgi:hypothetical protein